MATVSDPMPSSGTDPVDDSSVHSERTDNEVATVPDETADGRESESQDENLRHCENQHESLLESDEEEEKEEEGECGFCLFMKGGPCRDNFVKWEECVEGAEKAKEDIVAKCHQVTLLLKECMENNADYYDPVLRAEREMTEAAIEEAAALQDGSASKETDTASEAEGPPSSERQVENSKICEDGRLFEPENSEEAPRPSQQG